jgi:hypothetical protein
MMALGVAWLTAWGVAVASSGPPHSLHFLNAASFVAAGVAVIGLFVVFAVMYDWLAWLPRLYPNNTGLPLKVIAGSPHFHDWNYAASVVALPIEVTNRTGAPVTLAGGCHIQGNTGDMPSWAERMTEDETGFFLREIESQKRSSHHGPKITDRATIPGHASLEFWYVTDVSRDQRGPHLDMTLHFKDGDGNEYSAAFKRIPPAKETLSSSPQTPQTPSFT